MTKLRNWLAGAGLVTVGAIGTKLAVDYLKNRQKENVLQAVDDIEDHASDEVAYAVVEPSSVQDFLDKSFGEPGRYIPHRFPKVFEYQGVNYMVIWAEDRKKNKNQMLAFEYRGNQRKMIASVGYTPTQSDYNLDLQGTPFAIAINGEKIKQGQGQTKGTREVDLVLD